MHQTRKQASKKLPITKKGTQYIARASSHLQDSAPVVIAVRDMLKLARNAKEVKEMIKQKTLKINGKAVKDYRESIRLFNLFEADKPYVLSLLPTGKYVFEATKSKERLCKVVNKRLVSDNKVQLNLHDGSNVITKDKVNTQDSVYLDLSGKISKHVVFDKGKSCIIISGKYIGSKGKIESLKDGKANVKLDDNVEAELPPSGVIVI